MEADWEFEVGGDAPVIDACWPGFIDLQRIPERAFALQEAMEFPAMAEALANLNAVGSPVWTSKCDVWAVLDKDEFDADELDAPPGLAAHAVACYIDLLPRIGRLESNQQWTSQSDLETACKQTCNFLAKIPLRCCRLDLVIRQALVAPDQMGFGVTAYLTASGVSPVEARGTLQAALGAFTDALRGHSKVE
jgi:hypothetical protein